MQRCNCVSTGRSECRGRPEQRLGCRQLSAARRSHGLKLINTSELPMERSGPSPLRAVVNCLWVSNPSSWRWRRARRRIAASLVFFTAAAVGGGHSQWVSQWWLPLELMLRGRCTGFLQLCLRHQQGGVGWGGWTTPCVHFPLGRGEVI